MAPIRFEPHPPAPIQSAIREVPSPVRAAASCAAVADKVPARPIAEVEPVSEFDEHWNAGVEALLRRNFKVALQAFKDADAIRPGVPRVLANLKRLQEMENRMKEDLAE